MKLFKFDTKPLLKPVFTFAQLDMAKQTSEISYTTYKRENTFEMSPADVCLCFKCIKAETHIRYRYVQIVITSNVHLQCMWSSPYNEHYLKIHTCVRIIDFSFI